jgi:hypothetical protein
MPTLLGYLEQAASRLPAPPAYHRRPCARELINSGYRTRTVHGMSFSRERRPGSSHT